MRSVWRRFRLSLLLYARTDRLRGACSGRERLLGYYSGVADLHVRPGEIAHWLGTDAMLLAYAAGFALVPGALVGLAFALWRPSSREECGFAALSVGLLLGLFAEAALYATNGSDRFQERYLMVLLPLVFPAFVALAAARPARAASGRARRARAAGLSARVPLSGYTVSDFKQDSPFLLGRLPAREGGRDRRRLPRGRARRALRWRASPRPPPSARVSPVSRSAATLVASCRGLDRCGLVRPLVVRRSARPTCRPTPAGSTTPGVGDATLIQTPATPHARAHEQLFWNRSLTRARSSSTTPRRSTPSARPRVTRRRRRAAPARGQDDARPARDLELRRAGAARPARYRSPTAPTTSSGARPARRGWRCSSAASTTTAGSRRPATSRVYPASDGRVEGTLRLPLSLPRRPSATTLRLQGPGVDRRVDRRARARASS